MTEKKRIAIIEDHPIMRRGLADYFTQTGCWNVVGTASSLDEAKALLSCTPPDIVLLDIQLEDGWGLDIIPFLDELYFSEPDKIPLVAVYSTFDNYAYVSAALGMGVRAYVCKRRSENELEEALLLVLDGKTYVDDSVQLKLKTVASLFNVLTKREAEIMILVKKGLSNKQIADYLRISYRTVENILSCVYDKTGITTRLELQQM